MGNFETGVAAYIHARATVDVWFPVDHRGSADVSCNQCRFYRRSSRSCSLNDAICAYPERYVGEDCPLEPAEPNEEAEWV